MRLFLLFLLCPLVSNAQVKEGYYRELLRNTDGSRMAYATIQNARTHETINADKNGFFEIKVQEGDSVCISWNSTRRCFTVPVYMIRPNASGYREPGYAEVAPARSADYQKALLKNIFTDTIIATVQKNSQLTVTGMPHTYTSPDKLVKRGNHLTVKKFEKKRLTFAGNYTIGGELKKANTQPALQTDYAQGRNGLWRGAETGELFNYGPALNTVEYDGAHYDYDSNGRLVSKGAGNGKTPSPYNNDILGTGRQLVQSLTLDTRLKKGYTEKWLLKTRFTQSNEATIVKQNRNTSRNFYAAIVTNQKKHNFNFAYNNQYQRFTNNNRNGFLNRVYGSALITPASFDNKGGYLLSNRQKNFSPLADNPYFLLNENANGLEQRRQLFSLSVERAARPLRYKLVQSLEHGRQNSREGYAPFTAFFEDGIATLRRKTDNYYYLKADASYKTDFDNYEISGEAAMNYVFNNMDTRISYPDATYRYRRSTHELNLEYQFKYEDDFELGASLAGGGYLSNTASKDALLMPSVKLYYFSGNLFQKRSLKFLVGHTNHASEPGFDPHTAQSNLLQYDSHQWQRFFPTKEINHYNGLKTIQRRDWNAAAELRWNQFFNFTAEIYSRQVHNDVYAVFENNRLNWKNIAHHRTRGFEIELNYHRYNWSNHKKWDHSTILSFSHYRNKITQVAAGYDRIPYAGFADMRKELIKDQSIGSIVGSNWLLNNKGQRIIGPDGFPLVNNSRKIIGDAVPDFVLALTETLKWKHWSFEFRLNWQKGGDVWNGTRAVLDYLGRSAGSAEQRNITGYVFDGVLQNGQPNNIAVDFNNTQLPLSQNRWVRYGYTGVAEDYIEKADQLRLNQLSVSHKKIFRKTNQHLIVSAYTHNWLLWSASKGIDANQALFDQPDGQGLDLFNIPSTKNFGISISLQF
jgi:hypothetical protein